MALLYLRKGWSNVGAKSVILGIENEQDVIFAMEHSFHIKPDYKSLTLYIVYEREMVEKNYDKILPALVKVRTHYAALHDKTSGDLLLDEYPDMKFAILELTLRQQETSTLQNSIEIHYEDLINEIQDLTVPSEVLNNFEFLNEVSYDDNIVEIQLENPRPAIQEVPKPTEVLHNFEFGDQVTIDDVVPLIFYYRFEENANVRNTLTGALETVTLDSLKLIPVGRQRPKDTNVSVDGRCKYMIEGSKVTFVPKNSSVPIFCEISMFDAQNRAVLNCNGVEFTQVKWHEIWPTRTQQSSALQSEDSAFTLNNNNNNSMWSQVNFPSKRKNQEVPSLEKPKPMKRRQLSVYQQGDQLILFDDATNRYVQLSKDAAPETYVLNMRTGDIMRKWHYFFIPIPEQLAIPMNNKVIVESGEITYKYIAVDSYVLYYHEGSKLFYPCKVKSFPKRDGKNWLKLRCFKLGDVHDSLWKNIIPIEAYHLVKNKGKVIGFRNEEVTVEKIDKLLG